MKSKFRCITPKRFKRHPLGTLFMFSWVVMGLALRFNVDGHVWPYLVWPVNAALEDKNYTFGMYAVADSMVIAGVIFLIGHAMSTKKYAAFLRWLGLWIALFTSALIVFAISTAVYSGMVTVWFWPVSLVIWGCVIYGLGLALRIVRLEHFGHCESTYCYCVNDDIEVDGGECER